MIQVRVRYPRAPATNMAVRPALLIWQLVDSAFPGGGFTHSGGVEAAAHHGDVQTIDDCRRIAAIAVTQAGCGALPLVTAAHRVPSELADLDAIADTFLNQPVSNRASRAQGTSFFNAARRIFPEAPLAPIVETVSERQLRCHHAPMFGAILAALDVEIDDARRLFLYQVARTVVSAAVRLGVMGTFDAQRVQAGTADEIERTLERCGDLGPDDLAQTAPMLDLYQSTHDRLYSRLFQS